MYIASLHTRTGFVLGILSVSVCLSRCAPPVESTYDEDEFDCRRFTSNPTDWNKFTSSPNEYKDYNSKPISDTTVTILVVISMTALNVSLIIFVLMICRDYSPMSYTDTDTIVHLPPAHPTNMSRNRREPIGIHWSAGSGGENRLSFINLLAEMPSDAGRDPFTESNSNIPMFCATLASTDKPPAYEAVMTSDLSEQDIRFPSVTPERETDVPPPDYEEENLPKY